MRELDIDRLSRSLSEDQPAGPDLEYDADFTELDRLVAAAQAPGYDGDAEPPDWRVIDRLAHQLLERTRDLRIAVIVCRSALELNGVVGYRQGLALVRALVTSLWEHVHPQLNPDDDNDPTMRMNVLSSLCDPATALVPLRRAPMVASRVLGHFGWRDFLIAAGRLTTKDDEIEHTSMVTIQAAFKDTDVEQLQATATAIEGALADVEAIERITTGYVGAGAAISLDELRKLLADMHAAMQAQLGEVGGDVTVALPDGDSVTGRAGPASSGSVTGAGVPGEILNRQDVVRALDQIMAYYNRFEPTSPVPLLMLRAKRLATMNFMEIIRDLAPDGVSQVEMIRGPEENARAADESDISEEN